ncbi:MAG TPA: hypothetical protein VMW52_07615 [Phycisphaerae bacterium]|nr:hypothetical protein [Phycisphaerae bacterium]
MTGVERIAAERQRQIEQEGWTPEHDDKHVRWEMAVAAACYAVHNTTAIVKDGAGNPGWPWDEKWDKRNKHNRIRRLEIAGALIAAEIDRLLRLGEGD